MVDDLRKALEGLRTEELLDIVWRRDTEQWRPEAFPLVEEILAARGVDVAAAVASLDSRATYVDYQSLSTVATFSMAVDAHLCRMALEEAGIEAWVFNDSLAGVHVPLGMAIGVGVRVRPEQAQAARDVLEAVRSGEAAAPEETAPCPRCGSLETTRVRHTDRSLTVAAFLLVGTPVEQSSFRYACSSCGHRWE